MDITNYRYHQNGALSYYKKDNQTCHVEYDTNAYGPMRSDACIVSVSELSIETIMDKFMTGDMVLSEVIAGLSGRVENFKSSTQNGNILISFTYKGKSYNIQCNEEAASSQIDDNKVSTYTEIELKNLYKMSSEDVIQYFEAVKTENGVATEYAIKQSSGFKCVGELVNELNNTYNLDDLSNNLGFPSEYLINKYFEPSDGGYKLKAGININNKILTTIEELRAELGLQTLDEYINSLYSKDCGSIYGTENMPLSNISFAKNWLVKNYGMEDLHYWYYLQNNGCKEASDRFLSDVAAQVGCSVTDLSVVDIVQYLLTVDEDFSKELHEQYKQSQFFNAVGNDRTENTILGHVMDGTLWYQMNKICPNYGTSTIDGLRDIIYSHDSQLMNLPLVQAILSAANVTSDDSMSDIDLKVTQFLDNISKGYPKDYSGDNSYAPKYNVKSLVIYLFENGYIQETSFTEDEVAVYNLSSEEKEHFFYPATDADGNPILDKNGVQKYYKRTIDFTTDPTHPTYCSMDANMVYGDCIVVETAEELQSALNQGKSVILANDIDMSSIGNWTPVGTEDNPYTGNIYGNGYTIKNLNVSSSNQFTGMFGVFAGFAIDLNIENATVTNTNSETVTSTGVFAGKIIPQASSVSAVNIVNCNVTGKDYVGLLAGRVENPQFDNNLMQERQFINSQTFQNIHTSGNVSGGIAGGVFGYASTAINISDSSSSANINATKYAGGIVGAMDDMESVLSMITDCDFQGTFAGSAYFGTNLGCLLVDEDTFRWSFYGTQRAQYETELFSQIGSEVGSIVIQSDKYTTPLDFGKLPNTFYLNESFDISKISDNNEVFVPEPVFAKEDVQDLVILQNYIDTDDYDGQTSLDYVSNEDTGKKTPITDNNYPEIISNLELYGLNEDKKEALIEKTIEKLWNDSEKIKPIVTEDKQKAYFTWVKAIISAMGAKILYEFTRCDGRLTPQPNYIEFIVNGHKYHLPLHVGSVLGCSNENYRPLVFQSSYIKYICEKYGISFDDMIKFGGFGIYRSIDDKITDYWLDQNELIANYKYYFGDVSKVLDENGAISDPEIIAQILAKVVTSRKAEVE